MRTRHLPRPVRMQHRLPVAPLLRAVVDAVRQGAAEADAALYEVVQARGVAPEALEAELGRQRAAARPGVPQVLNDLGVGVRSPAEAQARQLIEAAPGVPRPLWNPRLYLDGEHLADPDAYWPDRGVMFEVDSLRHHFGVADHQRTLARHNRLARKGLMAMHATPGMVRSQPKRVLADLRGLLAGGPYGPWERVRVFVPRGGVDAM